MCVCSRVLSGHMNFWIYVHHQFPRDNPETLMITLNWRHQNPDSIVRLSNASQAVCYTLDVLIKRSLMQLHPMSKPPNHCRKCPVQLRICQTTQSLVKTSIKLIIEFLWTYFIPAHCLLPFENASRYFSRWLPSGWSHRSGSNFSGDGKTSSSLCIWSVLMLTGVPAGMVYDLLLNRSSLMKCDGL